MPIVVTCPSCGKSAHAPDSAAGKAARCLACGQTAQIPWQAEAQPLPMKTCIVCGVDVGGRKRTKDTAGRYYCQPCWTAKVQAGVAATLSRPSPQPAVATVGATSGAEFATPDFPRLPEPLPVDDAADDLQTLEECADCGLSVPAGELSPDVEGRMICGSCARNELPLAPEPALPASTYAPPRPVQPIPALPYRAAPPVQSRSMPRSNGGHFAQMAIGGAICVFGIVVTVGTYLAAVSGGGGRYTIAWGAIVFGAWRFVKGLAGLIGNP